MIGLSMPKEQLITFYPLDELKVKLAGYPKTASQSLPEWYKKMPSRMDGEVSVGLTKHGKPSAPNTTLKHCSPFLDALTTGYMYTAPCDIEIRLNTETNEHQFRWGIDDWDVISLHTMDQAPTLPNAYGSTNGLILKWNFHFLIKTPPGYSTLFTHPLNRSDLPFRTFSGVVETDTYTLPVNFPFQFIGLYEDPYIIKEGTPICQFLPFKREDWKPIEKEVEEYPYGGPEKAHFDLKKNIDRSYKDKFWQKKKYS